MSTNLSAETLSSLITVTTNGKKEIHVVARCASDDVELKFALRNFDKNTDSWGC